MTGTVQGFKTGGGIFVADQIQGHPSQYDGPSNVPNPLYFQFEAEFVTPNPDVPGSFIVTYQKFCSGTRCTADIVQGTYAPIAQSVQAI